MILFIHLHADFLLPPSLQCPWQLGTKVVMDQAGFKKHSFDLSSSVDHINERSIILTSNHIVTYKQK